MLKESSIGELTQPTRSKDRERTRQRLLKRSPSLRKRIRRQQTTKTAKGNKKPSEAQKEALKLIMKGYRVTADHKFFENAEGDKKACNWDSVVAMLRRYGMEYIPVGLVK